LITTTKTGILNYGKQRAISQKRKEKKEETQVMKYQWKTKLKVNSQGDLISEEPLSPVKRVHELDLIGRHRSEWVYREYDGRVARTDHHIDPFDLPAYTVWRKKVKKV